MIFCFSGGSKWPKGYLIQANLSQIIIIITNNHNNSSTINSPKVVLDLFIIAVELLLWPRVEVRSICKVWGCLMEAIIRHWNILAETEIIIWRWPRQKSGTTARETSNIKKLQFDTWRIFLFKNSKFICEFFVKSKTSTFSFIFILFLVEYIIIVKVLNKKIYRDL